MSVEVRPEPRVEIPARLAGTALAVEHWLEGASGFPPGSVGAAELGSASDVVVTARGVRLTRRQLDEVLAFTEFLAGQALPEADRSELTEHLVDAFEDSPKHASGFLRNLAGSVRRVSSLDPIQRCQRRLSALTSTYTIEQRRRTDGEDASPIMEMVGRHNPVVRYWASSGVVLVADALTARVELHRLVLTLVDREAEDSDSLTERLVDRTMFASRLENAELAASELRLLHTRAWLREMGNGALDRLRAEIAPAVASALDVDIVVQQVAYRAVLAQTPAR
jgi:hypothetical protein